MESPQLWQIDLEEGVDCIANAKSLGLAMSALSLSVPFLQRTNTRCVCLGYRWRHPGRNK